jgi:hypothetical protein
MLRAGDDDRMGPEMRPPCPVGCRGDPVRLGFGIILREVQLGMA